MQSNRPVAGAVPVWAVLGVVVAIALGLRWFGIADHTLTHAEAYAPRLVMPDWVSAPPPRTTLAETVAGTLRHDNHPPGYYVFLWAWTGFFGTGLAAIRGPSAVAGAATVAALFCVVRRRDGAAVAFTAAAFLALHGHHVFWSQQARMWAPLGALAVAALVAHDGVDRRGGVARSVAYVAILFLGLWFDYSFWPFVAAHISWICVCARSAPRAPKALGLAAASIVLSLPVLGFLVVHLGLDRTGYLAHTNLWDLFAGFLMLQWLVPPPAGGTFSGLASAALLIGFVLSCGMLAAGVAGAPRPSRLSGEAPSGNGNTGPALGRSWTAVRRSLAWLDRYPTADRWLSDPAAVHALVPVAVLFLVSLWVPSVTPRSLLFVTPFAAWLVARGLGVLVRPRMLRAGVTAALLAVTAASVLPYTRPAAVAHDAGALAAALRPVLAPGDRIFVHDTWWTQPLHYYLPAAEFDTVPFAAAHAHAQAARIWVVVLHPKDAEAFGAVAASLRRHREVRRVETPGAMAVLFERRGPGR